MTIEKTIKVSAQKAGDIMKEYFGKPFASYEKGHKNNLVTEVDTKAEQAIISTIRESFPEHGILSEEQDEIITSSDFRWIIDPLDGTMNYSHNVPLCAVSIALEHKKKITHGCIYCPFLNEFYYAEKNKGSFLNDKQIFVNKNKDEERLFVAVGFPYNKKKVGITPSKTFLKFTAKGISVRRIGAATINFAWVACGRLDAFFSFYLNAWDCAAGVILIKEAGGKITNFQNKEYSFDSTQVLASNGLIHHSVLNTIKY